ncbi:DUF2087 domain-containing protein [Gottfriedia luciferensis]|uniref:DUF2087 domain-containing protein n=1 Tax=Gottfriedia luciferensis TaxID=178774 RepID=UPI000B43C24A|nr:DUF2087 domain-containing protein [Gottfriedia luciferensis]
MGNVDAFWDAEIYELKQGYSEEKDHYVCLLCSEKIEKGMIYQDSGNLYEAEKFMKIHIEKNHHSVFDYLIQLDKKLTGLTEHQNHLLRLFYQGKSDAEIQKETGIGSTSTIRNHRFVLKEKERQAKLFLVMMELLKEKDQHAPTFLPLHKTAKLVDDRYNITEEEKEKSLLKYFPEGTDGPMKKFPLKEKQKLVVLREIVKRFTPNKKYTEKEINEVLTTVYHDYVVLRRYLIEYGFIDRKPDGSTYWLKV